VRTLNIQFQPQRAPGLDPAAVVELLKLVGSDERLASRAQVTEGIDDGPYINATYSTSDPVSLWAAVRERALGHEALGPALQRSVIITCTGDDGWDDYRLLHHFEETEPLDELT
jgi:hypothetical protein